MIPFLEEQETLYLLYIGVALGAFLLVTGLAQLLSRRENDGEARNRRLRMLARGASAEEVLALLRPQEGSGLLGRLPGLGSLPRELSRAGLVMAPSRFLLLCAGAALLGTAALLVVLPPVQAVPIALGLALLGPVAVLRSLRKKREERLIAQLPDALDLMARGLKVGHPLNTSIGAVAREMPDPIGTEFGLVFDQVSYGDDLVSAFADLSERLGVEDVHYLSVSIGIQHGTGGDLARVVELLAKTIRGRISMRRRIKAISGEGRLSALILTGVPFFLIGSVYTSSPGFYLDVMDDPMFLPMAGLALALIVVNGLVLNRLVNFRI